MFAQKTDLLGRQALPLAGHEIRNGLVQVIHGHDSDFFLAAVRAPVDRYIEQHDGLVDANVIAVRTRVGGHLLSTAHHAAHGPFLHAVITTAASSERNAATTHVLLREMR